MSTALALKPQERALKIDAVAEEFLDASRTQAVGGFALALKTADAMSQIREMLTPEMMAPVMQLMNSPLGFLTDKDPSKPQWKDGRPVEVKPYPVEVVRDCVIEARLRGLHLVGNQFNIIGGRTYVTKEGFKNNLLKNIPGLTDLKIIPGIPKMGASGDGAFVDMKATWKMNGQPQDLSLTLAIRVNKMMGADAILGKADRKMRSAIYGQITGTELTDGEAGDDAFDNAKQATVHGVQTVLPPPAAQSFSTPSPAAGGAPRSETPTPAATAPLEQHAPETAPVADLAPESAAATTSLPSKATPAQGVRNLCSAPTIAVSDAAVMMFLRSQGIDLGAAETLDEVEDIHLAGLIAGFASCVPALKRMQGTLDAQQTEVSPADESQDEGDQNRAKLRDLLAASELTEEALMAYLRSKRSATAKHETLDQLNDGRIGQTLAAWPQIKGELLSAKGVEA